jgi:hypothetical protein
MAKLDMAHFFFYARFSIISLKVTTSASPETTSPPQFLSAPAQRVASPQPLETKQSALPPLKPKPGEGLRRRATARCDYIPSISALILDVYMLCFLVISSHSVASSTTTNPPTLAEVIESMSPIQLEFFNKANAELYKVESFFIEREKEARERTVQLRGQLEELKDHRHLYHVSSSIISSFACYRLGGKCSTKEAHPDIQTALSCIPFSGSKISTLMSYLPRLLRRSSQTDNKAHNADADVPREIPTRHLAGGASLEPDEYLPARKQLKRAVSEHYHALEVLNNYRVRPALSYW